MATERGDAFWMGFRGMIRENAGWTKDRTKPGDKCHAQRFLRVGSKGGEYTQAFEQALHPAQEL